MFRNTPPWIRFIEGTDGTTPTPTDGEPTTPETSGEPDSRDGEWEQAFPGLTPADVKEKIAEVDKWKEFSRKWESRSKESKKNVDQTQRKLDEAETALSETREKAELFSGAQRELDLVYELLDQGADVRLALDSRSFMAEVEKLDRADEAYAEKVKAAVEKLTKRLPQSGYINPHPFESGNGDAKNHGPSLWDLVNGTKNTNPINN